jgi:hypothetical protein
MLTSTPETPALVLTPRPHVQEDEELADQEVVTD